MAHVPTSAIASTSANDESNLQHVPGFGSGSDHVALSGHAAPSAWAVVDARGR